jgi:hypothetical protein
MGRNLKVVIDGRETTAAYCKQVFLLNSESYGDAEKLATTLGVDEDGILFVNPLAIETLHISPVGA